MTKFIPSEDLLDEIKLVCSQAEKEVLICSAWITPEGIRQILESLPDKPLNIKILVRAAELKDLQITSNRVFSYLNRLKDKHSIEYAFHNSLHAKFIVIDNKFALLGSANITYSGIEPEGGNIEAAVLIEDQKEIEKLREYFFQIWNAKLELGEVFVPEDDIIGFITNPTKAGSIEAILLQEADLNEGEFIVFSDYGKLYLARVSEIMGWDVAFFLNPFTQGDHPLFPSINDFRRIFGEQREKEWRMAALYSLIQQSSYIRTMTAKILGCIQDGELKPSLTAVRIGLPVRKARYEDIRDVIGAGVRIGRYINSDIPAFLNLEEVRRKHIAILGTTGSGKSYFAKLFIERALELLNAAYIFDPHGEYAGLKDAKSVELENTLLYFDSEKLVELLAGFGAAVKGASSEVKENKKALNKWVHSLLAGKIEKNLYEVLVEREMEEYADLLSEEFGENALKNQAEVLKRIDEAINYDKAVVFDFKKIEEPEIRCEIAGYILRRLFIKAKAAGDLKSLVVLEEAHNFAPERGYGEVSAGRENLSKTYALKIASEGRKFGLGLVAISQRPAQVSKYLLSQTNTQVLFRMVNKGDIEAVESAIESASRDIVDRLPDLKTGYAFVTGVGIPISALVEIE